MELINLKSLNLTSEESGDIIKFLAPRRGIITKKLLSTIKLNLKCKNNKDLASKSQQKLIKTQQKLTKTQLSLIKSQRELIKSIKSQQKLTKQTKLQRELIKSQQNLKKQRLIKSQQTKEIRNHLYNIDNNNSNKFDNNSNKLDNNNNSNKLDNKLDNNKLDKKINNNDDFIENIRDLFSNTLDKKINNNNNDDFIENIRDLFKIVNYEPILIKTGFDSNYLEYRSEGNNSLSFEEYIILIKPYLHDLINVYKTKGEWKLQLSAEISFVSQKPDSDEMRIMYTRSFCEEIMSGNETEEIMENLLSHYYKNTRIIYKIK